MKQKIILSIGLFQLCFYGWGQQAPTPYTTPYAGTPAQAVTTANAAWYIGGNSPGGTAGNANIFGTMWNSDIWITTNNRYIAKFSTNNGLNGLNGTGDGLRINNMTPSAPVGLGEIDIFTTGSNGTEIRFGGSGNIRGANNRFEMWGSYNGLFFNTYSGGATQKFAQNSVVYGFLGSMEANAKWWVGCAWT